MISPPQTSSVVGECVVVTVELVVQNPPIEGILLVVGYFDNTDCEDQP